MLVHAIRLELSPSCVPRIIREMTHFIVDCREKSMTFKNVTFTNGTATTLLRDHSRTRNHTVELIIKMDI